MISMAKQTKRTGSGEGRKRNTIFVTLDDATEARLQHWLDRQRVKPDRAAVALTALIEFLEREERSERQ